METAHARLSGLTQADARYQSMALKSKKANPEGLA